MNLEGSGNAIKAYRTRLGFTQNDLASPPCPSRPGASGPRSTAFSADLAIVLNAFFYPLTEHMIARDGVPIKYVGDELFSFFAGEDHRLRAF
jgi:hypothetical protein